jgi:hypothetical protein
MGAMPTEFAPPHVRAIPHPGLPPRAGEGDTASRHLATIGMRITNLNRHPLLHIMRVVSNALLVSLKCFNPFPLIFSKILILSS